MSERQNIIMFYTTKLYLTSVPNGFRAVWREITIYDTFAIYCLSERKKNKDISISFCVKS